MSIRSMIISPEQMVVIITYLNISRVVVPDKNFVEICLN